MRNEIIKSHWRLCVCVCVCVCVYVYLCVFVCLYVRVISRNLKLGGIDKYLGGVNMREVQIYIKNH